MAGRLAPDARARAPFELRYFEIAPGGFSSLEKHEHVQVVVAARGRGRALIGTDVVDLAPMDVVETPPWAPHRWVTVGDAPFGFLCTVHAERDRPQPLDDAEWEALLGDPRTAPFAFYGAEPAGTATDGTSAATAPRARPAVPRA